MTTRANLYVDQGVDFLVTLNLSSDDGEEFQITNQQFFCDVRKLYSTKLAFSAELEVVVNGITNELDLFIAPEKTKSLQPGKYQYDILMVGSTTTKLLEGLMFILPTMTALPIPVPDDLSE
jgi:hypothetical protein